MKQENCIALRNGDFNVIENVKNLIYILKRNQIGKILKRLDNVENQLITYDKKLKEILDEFENEREKSFKQKIFFKGQIYDAYSLIIDIIKTANKKILIIDNYLDNSVLKMLTKKNNKVEVLLLTSGKSPIRKIDITKFNSQYPKLRMQYTNRFHDRFIVIDNKDLYHLGASIKDLGNKCFGINKINETEIIQKFVNIK